MQTLPITRNLPDFIQTVHLDDGHKSYPVRIKLKWMDRLGESGQGMWTISLYLTSGEAILLNLPLVVGLDINSRFASESLGKGVLVCTHTEGIKEIGRDDLFEGVATINYLQEVEYDNLT